jgi:formylglycine-generating enzyme required for sulfatase activity
MTKLIFHRQQRQATYYTEELKLSPDFALDMIEIPSGTFMMGTPDIEIERLCKEYGVDYFQRERPQHKVKISSFFIPSISS